MAKRILVLEGHPGPDSLCGALAASYVQGATRAGHDVKLLRLSQMQFDPDMGPGFKPEKVLEPCLAEVQAAITWCEHLVIVHPLWWGLMPAKLKGLIDRVLLPGFAFRYEPGQMVPAKLLKGRSAEVLVTSDTPPWYLRFLLWTPGYRAMRKQILEFCGFSPVRFRTFAPVHGSDEAKRKGWIGKAGRYGEAA